MTELGDRLLNFFVDNLPSWQAMVVGGPLGASWAFACLHVAGWLKRHHGLKTGYSRKIFHFLIFTTAAVLQAGWGTSHVCLFGGMTSLIILYALLRGPGHTLYEAMARERDAPHQTYYIIAPYFATLLGGIASNVLFGEIAVVGYLVAGLGDAIGEPVGTRFGKHTYRVPAFRGVKSTRSYEGSAAVFLASSIAITMGILICSDLHLSPHSVITIPLLAIACTGLEAVSPHGWDNATIQLIPSWLISLF